MSESRINSQIGQESLRARIWMGIIIFLNWLTFFVLAGMTFPFIGNETRSENLIYGLIVGIPFFVLLTIYMLLAVKDLRVAEGKGRV